MRSIILFSAVSLDHFIAKPDGDIEWLHAPEYASSGEDYGYQKFYDGVETTLIGNNTYKTISGFDTPFPYPEKTNYVFSHAKGNKDTGFVRFVKEDAVDFIRRLKSTKGKDIWLVGGGKLNALLLKNGLIDKMILTYIPLILGEGISLFDGNTAEAKFSLEKSKAYNNGLVQLTYSKIK